jgi:hypothetical protein
MEKHCRQIRSQESKQASTTNDLSLAGEAYTLRTIFLPNHTSPFNNAGDRLESLQEITNLDKECTIYKYKKSLWFLKNATQ